MVELLNHKVRNLNKNVCFVQKHMRMLLTLTGHIKNKTFTCTKRTNEQITR
jgi:hypothetical protein